MPTRWYVNLSPNMSKHQGGHIRLVAKIDPERRVNDDCTWTVNAAGGNTHSQYLATDERGRYESQTTSQEKSGTDRYRFKNTFYLPHVGGDRFTLSCHLNSAPGNALFTKEYETWRKFYYTVHYMNIACKDFFERLIRQVKAVFERSYIELVEYKRAQTLKDEANTPCDSNVRLTHLYRSPQYPFIHKPHHMRVVVVNDVYDTADTDVIESNIRHNTNRVINDADGDLKYRLQVVSSGDDWILRLNFGADYGLAERWDRGNVRIETSEHSPAGGPNPRPKPVTYASAQYNMKPMGTLSNGGRRLEFRIQPTGPTRAVHNALSDDENYGDRKLKLTVETRMREHYCGHMYKNVAVIRINEEGDLATRLRTVLQTLVHEMGHGFQQVVRRERTYDGGGAPVGWDDNALYYTGHGGQGPHCSLNTQDDGHGVYVFDPGAGGDLCVMYHADEDHVDAQGRFCGSCETRLKRSNLGKDAMTVRGWDRAYE